MIRNERGVVMIEFIFSIVIAAGMAVVLFAVTYTLAVMEITQYVAYSTARVHAAGNKNPEMQKEAARAKYKQLTTGQSAIATLYSGAWFKIAKPDEVDIRAGVTGDGKSFSQDLAGGSDARNWFIGVSVPFTSMLMNIKLPFLGSTNPDNEDSTFSTRLNAMIIREPSQKECQDFMEKRRGALSSLPSGQTYYQQGAYIPLEDNGC